MVLDLKNGKSIAPPEILLPSDLQFPLYFKLRDDYKCSHSVIPFPYFFFASSTLFFFPSTFAPHHEQLTLYMTISNTDWL
jgi:hypothetical protein